MISASACLLWVSNKTTPKCFQNLSCISREKRAGNLMNLSIFLHIFGAGLSVCLGLAASVRHRACLLLIGRIETTWLETDHVTRRGGKSVAMEARAIWGFPGRIWSRGSRKMNIIFPWIVLRQTPDIRFDPGRHLSMQESQNSKMAVMCKYYNLRIESLLSKKMSKDFREREGCPMELVSYCWEWL